MINDIIFDFIEKQFKEVVKTEYTFNGAIHTTADGATYHIGGGNKFQFVASKDIVGYMNELKEAQGRLNDLLLGLMVFLKYPVMDIMENIYTKEELKDMMENIHREADRFFKENF